MRLTENFNSKQTIDQVQKNWQNPRVEHEAKFCALPFFQSHLFARSIVSGMFDEELVVNSKKVGEVRVF